jgi:uncharacterized membrane protein YhiD involved in acid resistance
MNNNIISKHIDNDIYNLVYNTISHKIKPDNNENLYINILTCIIIIIIILLFVFYCKKYKYHQDNKKQNNEKPQDNPPQHIHKNHNMKEILEMQQQINELKTLHQEQHLKEQHLLNELKKIKQTTQIPNHNYYEIGKNKNIIQIDDQLVIEAPYI